MPEMNETRESEYRGFHKWHWMLLFVVLGSSILLVHQNVSDFKVSVISTQSAPAFDGTVYPVKQVPKWTKLTSDEWDLSFSQIPSAKLQPTPTYNANQLKTSTESLGWSDPTDLAIRDAKITYSVPYMGNYKLDGHEMAGSHLAVDIKVPSGTPVYAIANGVVTKVSEQSTGFGKHIVVRHDNAPSLSNTSSKETLYSSYSHLGEVLIAEGDVVLKGKLIGKSGETGTATTPHVHFQIDNSNAPWHPYWPFTFQEANDAGLSFTEAINTGLGQSKALETTVNPVVYVQTYLDGSAATTPAPTTTTPTITPSTLPSDTSSSELPPSVDNESSVDTSSDVTTTPEVVEEEPVVKTPPAVKFVLEHDDVFTKGVSETITVRALDADGAVVSTYLPAQDLSVQVLEGSADVPSGVSARGFTNGEAKFTITPTSDSKLQIRVTDQDILGDSRVMQSVMFHDVSGDAEYFEAVHFLKQHDVIGGYPDGSFKPDNVVSRVEALKFILNGINSDLVAGNSLPFPDTSAREWYSTYVATGYNRSIINGYPDQTFRPANTVNRAEFLKMLLTAMEVDVDMSVTRDVYSDVLKDDWFAPYVAYAKEKNLITHKGGNFYPDEGMTRAEVADLIYRTIVLKVSGRDRFSSGIEISEGDAADFFS